MQAAPRRALPDSPPDAHSGASNCGFQAESEAWKLPDPEAPAVSVVEPGIIRDTPVAAGVGRMALETRLDPPWTSDWIGEAARERLRAYGIVSPTGRAAVGGARPIRFVKPTLSCPRCGSNDPERLSEFGSTGCKETFRCKRCAEPFEYFKPI